MIVEILNLSSSQLDSIKSQTCNMQFNGTSLVGMRYKAELRSGAVKLIGWNHGGHFDGVFQASQVRIVSDGEGSISL